MINADYSSRHMQFKEKNKYAKKIAKLFDFTFVVITISVSYSMKTS